jgi:hypothetical protein
MKPVPIRRKGCKNVGWIWSRRQKGKARTKVVVKLHPDKEMTYLSKPIQYPFSKLSYEQVMWKNVLPDARGIFHKLPLAPHDRIKE